MEIISEDFDLFENQLNKKEAHKNDLNNNKNTKQQKLPKKSKGGYKPILIDLESLKNEAEYMEIEINRIINYWQIGEINNQDVTSLYIIAYLFKRHPNNFLESYHPIIKQNELPQYKYESKSLIDYIPKLFENPNLKRRLNETSTNTLFDLINNFNLHCIPKASRIAIVKWYFAIYDIVPMTRIAKVKEVIELQANKKRCVTLSSKKLDQLIEGHRDALSFVLHDLQHAYKMFENEVLFKGQVAFSILMLKIIDCNLIKNFLKTDSDFKENFYYLVSDMNSHTKHLFFHFKTCLINAFKKQYNLTGNEHLNDVSLEDFNKNFDYLLDLFEMSDLEKQSARQVLGLNSEDQFNNFDFIVLNNFFLNLYDSKFNK